MMVFDDKNDKKCLLIWSDFRIKFHLDNTGHKMIGFSEVDYASFTSLDSIA